MRPSEQDSPADLALIDRIVDGGMTPEELRAAVSRLEITPDGWKRCAVAFLEGQILGESLRALGQPQKEETNSQILPFHLAKATKRPLLRPLRHGMAAGIVAASFAIGWVAHGVRLGTPSHHSLALDAGTTPTRPASVLVDSANSSRTPDAPAEAQSANSSDRDEQIQERPQPSIRTVGRIRFGPESSPAEVPLLAGPGITQEWLTQQPPPVSEHGRVVLERNGYQVEQRRRYFTTVLADGRRVAFPVDHVQIQYTGNAPL